MAQKQDQLLDHDYDGIKEYDNDLPSWWLWLFYITIIISAVYAVWFHGGFTERAQDKVAREIAAQQQTAATQAKAGPTEERLLALVNDPKMLAVGKEVFAGKCSPCHGPDGGGLIGPNLTDKYWIHGGRITDIHRTITEGVPDKGMVTWDGIISDDEINAVAAFIWTLYGTTPGTPKEPQGEPFERP